MEQTLEEAMLKADPPRWPKHPSVQAVVAPERYMDAVGALAGVPHTFFDGVAILVPTGDAKTIKMLQAEFGATVAEADTRQWEFPTKALAAGVGDELVRLGAAIWDRTGETADEMVAKALAMPGETLADWQATYVAAMTTH